MLASSTHALSGRRFTPPLCEPPAVYRSLMTMRLGALDGLHLGPVSPEPSEWNVPDMIPKHVELVPMATLHQLSDTSSPELDDAPAPTAVHLPGDVFDQILSLLSPHPDLFAAAAVCRTWSHAVRANYDSRSIFVPAIADALAPAIAAAPAGATLILQPGLHELSATLTITSPIRLRLGGDGCLPCTLVAKDFINMRLKAPTCVEGVALVRTFVSGTYPNSVVHCESSKLLLIDCRVSGAVGAPSSPLAPSATEPPPTPASPQTGISVGPGASVELRDCRVVGHRGPAVKVCRGRLVAARSEISGSACGANVVVNGGVIRLHDNDIHSACGDGISLWNNPSTEIEGNRIHSNQGAGVSIRSGSGDVRITNNHVHSNRAAAFQFTTSHAHAWIEGNIVDEVAHVRAPEPLPETLLAGDVPIASIACASFTMPVLPSVGAGGIGGVVVMP
ncbi:hypothetical protein KFE25_001006 [Diacronema lutheri]|uniref:F-box domain-containing protein n=1 Tax=Diacronema lutheri TaxID=2081491 RepID=A0A8J6C7B2_DIALT|nr:hypothetical protein KFE25_001006 [Diacronema lutheri]